MKTLLVMRHGRTNGPEPGQRDYDRTLNDQGSYDVAGMGQLIGEQGLRVDAILSSTAQRASQTAEKMAKTCGYEQDILFERALYLTPADGIIEVLAQLQGDPNGVLLVGHNSGLEALVAGLTRNFRTMPTAALARLELPIDCWAELTLRTQARCPDFWLPRK